MIEVSLFVIVIGAGLGVANKILDNKRKRERAFWKAKIQRIKKLDGGIL